MLEVDIKEITLSTGSGQKSILNNINFSIPPKNIFTILGNNGAGKTTLINGIARLLDNRVFGVTGNVKLDDKDVLKLTGIELLELRKKTIKVIFQDAADSFDPLKKIGYYFDKFAENKEEISGLLEFFLLPRYDELSKLFPYEISGGMAQRIIIILALSCNPLLLILDEPTSAIDTPISNLLGMKLREYVGKSPGSVLMVTQDLNFAINISDKIAYMHDGKLTGFIPANELKNLDKLPSKLSLLELFEENIE